MVWISGLFALLCLIWTGITTLFKSGKLADNFAKTFAAPATQRLGFSVLRAFCPNLSLRKKLVKSYDNNGTVIVTRHNDCLDVLNRNEDFEVVYGSRMRKLTEGENFFLGMQPGWDYSRDTSAMTLAMQRPDVAQIIQPRAEKLTKQAVETCGGKIDFVQEIGLHVPWDMTHHYFGVGGPSEAQMRDWTTHLFWYLFEDLGADPALDETAMKDAQALRNYLDQTIAEQKKLQTPSNIETDHQTVLSRCLDLQSANMPGMSDLGIRNNLLGLVIGAIPTLNKACCYALDELLNRPTALQQAQQAAANGDEETVARLIWEALRFRPHNPVIYRRAIHDCVIAQSTLRRQKIKKGQLVFAATLSAMFDPFAIPNPGQFSCNRPWEDYIIWGYGMHTCFGAAINRSVIPAMLCPILKQKNLRRASGPAGQIDTGGTPYPQHFHLEFDQ